MRDVVRKFRDRLRHGLAVQEILDRFARHGVVFYPYIVFRERADARATRSPLLDNLTVRRLTEDDAPQLAVAAPRPRDAEDIRNRLRQGWIGLGAFDRDALVAYTWCDLERLGGIGTPMLRPLESDEAYLLDAYALPAYRGHGLVPYLRSEMYAVLAALGRRRFYSVSLFFNRSARRFKVKLGAYPIELRVSIRLWHTFKRDLRLKRYAGVEATPGVEPPLTGAG